MPLPVPVTALADPVAVPVTRPAVPVAVPAPLQVTIDAVELTQAEVVIRTGFLPVTTMMQAVLLPVTMMKAVLLPVTATTMEERCAKEVPLLSNASASANLVPHNATETRNL